MMAKHPIILYLITVGGLCVGISLLLAMWLSTIEQSGQFANWGIYTGLVWDILTEVSLSASRESNRND